MHYPPHPGHGGYYPWPHWSPPYYPRPIYYWDWYRIESVTCTAVDSYGDLFPVTEDGYIGDVYRDRLEYIEDAAIDRCYYETGGDPGCRLYDCYVTYR